MDIIASTQSFVHSLSMPVLLVLGLTVLVSYYVGKVARLLKLPSLIGFMVIGVILGPSVLDLLNDNLQEELAFITEIALGFVAFMIGLELSLTSLKRQGIGIVSIILAESFGAFAAVTLAVYALTRDLPLSLIFGAMAPASAPAGTVAVIKEFRAKGNLTKALYAVVGFDDGVAIIIFGFAAALARSMLLREAGHISEGLFTAMAHPLKEVFLSFLIGFLIAVVFCILVRRLKNQRDVLVLIFGFILVVNGISIAMHLSLILTNMVLGFTVVNTQKDSLVQGMANHLSSIMSILFILFFTLAGAHLHIALLPSLGLIGIIYIIFRSLGKIVGARIGSLFGKVDENIKKYVGIGILSQAGVAIGLALIVKHEFAGIGNTVGTMNGDSVTSGDHIGLMILTTVTVTCIFFEIIGPILTKFALHKAGEIDPSSSNESSGRLHAS